MRRPCAFVQIIQTWMGGLVALFNLQAHQYFDHETCGYGLECPSATTIKVPYYPHTMLNTTLDTASHTTHNVRNQRYKNASVDKATAVSNGMQKLSYSYCRKSKKASHTWTSGGMYIRKEGTKRAALSSRPV